MLDYLWHLRGSVPLSGAATNQAVLDRLEGLLEQQRKPIVGLDANHLTFDAPLWENIFGPSWQAMVIYDRGRFSIDQGIAGRVLRYDLRSLHAFVFCLFGATMFFAFGLAGGGLTDGLKLAALAFGWLYGMNVLTALARVPRLVRKSARDT